MSQDKIKTNNLEMGISKIEEKLAAINNKIKKIDLQKKLLIEKKMRLIKERDFMKFNDIIHMNKDEISKILGDDIVNTLISIVDNNK